MTDTSKEFIAMSDCPEVQERKEGLECYDCVVIKKQAKIGFIVGHIYQYNNPMKPIVDIKDEGEEEFLREELIYLPDQRTLQEWMVNWFESCEGQWTLFETVYNAMRYYCILEDRNIPVKSMEQLWLAMFMDTVHSKFWKGGKWIRK